MSTCRTCRRPLIAGDHQEVCTDCDPAIQYADPDGVRPAVSRPGRFEEDGAMMTDAGHVGGELQSGPSYGRRWIADNDDGTATVVDIYAYDAVQTDDDGKPTDTWVQVHAHATVCTDPTDPGTTEVRSSFAFWDGMGRDPDATPRGICESLNLEDVHAAADLVG
jgi:hypothetical protein